ncbi:MAG: hypothetical protein M3Z98_01715 [Candidatus Dormibacteraeota bacterium]|nr:hypothetical protein [Candidatus Dormibacteraeota bacterium]
MREQIRRAFDAMTEAPHPALRSALRARLEAGAGDAPPRFWKVSVALTLAAGVVGLAFVVSINMVPRGGKNVPVATATATPSAEPTATPTAVPSPSPSAAPTATPACTSFSGGTSAGSDVTDVRVGTSAGYDRIVIQFDGPVPSYTVTPQGSPAFMQDGSGQTLTLQGTSGVKIVVRGASGWDLNGHQTFTGSQDLKPGYPVLKEARQTGDFERVFSWGLGLSQPNCVQVTTLAGPDRLVVDVLKP